MRNIYRLFTALVLTGLSVLAQSADTLVYRAVLSPRNEVPALTIDASGSSTVWVHIVRNGQGEIISGSVDFVTRYQFPGEVTFTGMHIHRGAAGSNGPVVIDSGLPGPLPDTTGRGVLRLQGQVLPTNANGLAALRDLINDPSGFYVNVHSTVNPGGVIRGQLQPADVLVVMAQMNPRNEVPAITNLNASATGSLMLIAARDASRNITSAEAIFDLNYTGFPAGTQFTGWHIHSGAAGSNGPVTLDSALAGPVDASATGAGTLHSENAVELNDRNQATLYGLFSNPSNFYMNLHTTVNPGGAVRGQARGTDKASFLMLKTPRNEVPAITSLDASALSTFNLYTIRGADGRVQAGVAVFDVNYRFPGETQFTGLHIHDGVAGANGGVTIDSGLNSRNQPLSASGFGNIYRVMLHDGERAVNSMNSLVENPENHYMNLHTTVNGGGAVRSQVQQASTARPSVTAVISAVSNPLITTVAPLGQMTIFGTDLMKAPSTSRAFDGQAPTRLNGTSVTIGGKPAAILELGYEPSFVPTDYIVAQVPADAEPGVQPVVVTNSNGAGNTTSVTVERIAPAVFFDAEGAIVYHVSNMSLVRNQNPAVAGEPLAVLMTGLGQTLPALATGAFAPGSTNLVTAPVTVTINGQQARISGAAAVPGFAGFYLVLFDMPQNVRGTAQMVVRVGGTASNGVTFAAQ